MKPATAIIAAFTLSSLGVAAAASGSAAAQEAAAQRARAIVQEMTAEERMLLLSGVFPGRMKSPPAGSIRAAGFVPGIARLGIPDLRESDAGMGVANLMNLRVDDVATALPSGLATAASWDRSLAYEGGAMIGSEARAKGFNVLLGGAVNLVRDPRTGRNFEYAGEDALLSGVIAGEGIRGIQSNKILSTVKHYAINDQETGRNVLNAKIAEASLRESDLLAFQLAIEIGRPASVMCGYNRINGIYACEHPFLLNEVLKKDWGYPGWVMSDWGAVHSTVGAALGGLDHQSAYMLDAKPYFGAPLAAAAARGEVPASRIEDMNQRIVHSMVETGLMDNPVSLAPQPIDFDANAKVSRHAAEGGIVLLKNDGGRLPIAAGTRTIALIGGHADIGVLSGGGSSQVRPVGGPALELKPGGLAAAFASITYFPSSPLKALQQRLPGAVVRYASGDDLHAALALARGSDLAIVFANQWTTEMEDVPTLALPDNQDALIARVAAVNSNTVVVLQTGGPVLMPWKDRVAAIVEAWYPGSAGGDAIANVLTGAVDAAGRLPLTFPESEQQLPRPTIPGLVASTSGSGQVSYGLAKGLKTFDVDYDIEGADIGYRWFERTGAKPLFPFGFGLSYASFAYGPLAARPDKPLSVRFTVTNTSKRAGTDTPQVYAAVKGRDGKRIARLVGWGRVNLAAGESCSVAVDIDPRLLANFDTGRRKWIVEKGSYPVYLGRFAGDRRQQAAIEVPAREIEP